MAVAYLDVTAFIRSSADRHLPRPTGGLEWRSIIAAWRLSRTCRRPRKKRKKCLPDRSSLLLIDIYIVYHSQRWVYFHLLMRNSSRSISFLSFYFDWYQTDTHTHMHTLTDWIHQSQVCTRAPAIRAAHESRLYREIDYDFKRSNVWDYCCVFLIARCIFEKIVLIAILSRRRLVVSKDERCFNIAWSSPGPDGCCQSNRFSHETNWSRASLRQSVYITSLV